MFNDPATTATYTAGPTRSLPDALPSSGSRGFARRDQPRRTGADHQDVAMRVALGVAVRIGHRRGDAEARRRADTRRSEEHTSELQSLMRISYAVFCLKKKKSNSQRNNTH